MSNETNFLVKLFAISEYRIVNMIVLYIILCVLFFVAIAFITVGFMILIECIEKILYTLNKLVFGKEHQKSLEYNWFILWFAKLNADITFILDWIKYDFLQIKYKTDSDKRSTTRWARWLSLENMVKFIKRIFSFFFGISGIHLLVGGITLYTYYGKKVIVVMGQLMDVFIQSKITTSQFLDAFEIITILGLLGYIVFDIRHKANGYSDIRAERFKELICMEEELLTILCGMIYSLEKNIDIIVSRKQFILQRGASSLSGKECYIKDAKIEFEVKNKWLCTYTDDAMMQFSDLDEIEDEFEKLEELDKKFKESSLNYLNIILIDRNEMLTKTVHFWTPGIGNIEYEKMRFFCKSSMEKWYKNWFEAPIKSLDGDKEKKYLSEEQSNDTILRASAILDFELIRAFWLELYIKKYIRKLERRFKKLNNFSKFKLH